LTLARLGRRRIDEAGALLERVAPSDPYYTSAQERLERLL